eukprot:scaffold46527_cov63-Phaeocystis_antarctica.AAC.3
MAPAWSHQKPVECAVLPSKARKVRLEGVTALCARCAITGRGSSGSAKPAQPPEAALPTMVFLALVVLLDAVLEVVAVACDVVRHVLRDGNVRRAVYRDAAVVGAVDRTVTHVRARPALRTHDMKVQWVPAKLVGLPHLEELDACHLGRRLGPRDKDVPTEAGKVRGGARHPIRSQPPLRVRAARWRDVGGRRVAVRTLDDDSAR